jgi:hypothetical protein
MHIHLNMLLKVQVDGIWYLDGKKHEDLLVRNAVCQVFIEGGVTANTTSSTNSISSSSAVVKKEEEAEREQKATTDTTAAAAVDADDDVEEVSLTVP